MPACAPSRPLPFSTVTEKDLCVNEWAKCPSASARPTPWSHSPISPHGPAPCDLPHGPCVLPLAFPPEFPCACVRPLARALCQCARSPARKRVQLYPGK